MRMGDRFYIKEKFEYINRKNYFGFLRRGFCNEINPNQIINEEGAPLAIDTCLPTWRYKDKFFVRKLKDEELNTKGGLPDRFLNSITLESLGVWMNPPLNVGIIYDGTVENLLLEKSSCYFITQYIQGDSFLKKISGLDPRERKFIFIWLSNILEEYSERGVFHFDFAPRDIILRDKDNFPIIVDTEHIEVCPFLGDPICKSLRNKQIKQFKEDYKSFLKSSELEKAIEIVFK